jgi:hypothetical protein
MSTKTVVFTCASKTDAGVTVTANRLKEAGFRIVPEALLKGQTYSATLTDRNGNTTKTKLVVNRSVVNGGTSTTFYAYVDELVKPVVGRPVTYSITNLRKVR